MLVKYMIAVYLRPSERLITTAIHICCYYIVKRHFNFISIVRTPLTPNFNEGKFLKNRNLRTHVIFSLALRNRYDSLYSKTWISSRSLESCNKLTHRSVVCIRFLESKSTLCVTFGTILEMSENYFGRGGQRTKKDFSAT